MTTRRSVLGFLASVWPSAALASYQPEQPAVVSPPTVPLNVSTGSGYQSCSDYAIGASVVYAYSYVVGSAETVASPTSSPVTAVANGNNPDRAAGCGFTITASSDSSVTGIRVYRQVNGSWTKYRDFPNSTTAIVDVTGLLNVEGQPKGFSIACYVCGNNDIRDLELNVSGAVVDADHTRIVIRRDLPTEQYCGNCGTKRIKRTV